MLPCRTIAELAQLRFDPARIVRRAQFSSLHGPVAPWLRQTPAGDGLWAGTQFEFARDVHDAQWLVVCDEPAPGLTTRVPRERRILFLGEPPAIRRYPLRYLEQYGTVVGPIRFGGYRGRQVLQHAALPWHLGKHCALDWATLAADKPKSELASVFCSNLRVTPQQRRRLAFVDALEQQLGSRVARFGRGFRAVVDKAAGIHPYRYHLALENNDDAGFWTEKLADAYLGDCFPLHAGGAVDAGDFDPAALVRLDLGDIAAAVATVAQVVASGRDLDARDLVRAQRIRVMTQHNLFAVADRIMAGNSGAQAARPLRQPVALLPVSPARWRVAARARWTRFIARNAGRAGTKG